MLPTEQGQLLNDLSQRVNQWTLHFCLTADKCKKVKAYAFIAVTSDGLKHKVCLQKMLSDTGHDYVKTLQPKKENAVEF